MKKMKRMIVCALVLAVLSLYNLSVFAAQTGCEHIWDIYDKKLVYSGIGECTANHNNCTVYVRWYDIRYVCGICGVGTAEQITEETHVY